MKKSALFQSAQIESLVIYEKNSDAYNPGFIPESFGMHVVPSIVSGRTDITGYVLTSHDNYGKVTWKPSSGGGGGSTPGGPLKSIQFHDTAGVLNGTSSLQWDKSSSTLSVTGTSILGGLSVAGGDITGLSSVPPSDSSAASKEYVDNLVGNGISWKNSVRVASTTTIIPNGSVTIDGVSDLSSGQRVLLKNQADPIENGIYNVNTVGGWSRTSDMLLGSKASGVAVWVNEGTSNSDQGWVCTSDEAVVEDDDLVFTNFTSSSSTPAAGIVSQVQFNGGGNSFAASGDFIWDDSFKRLSLGKDDGVGFIELGTSSDNMFIGFNGTESTILNNFTGGKLVLRNDGGTQIDIQSVIIDDKSILLEDNSSGNKITLKAPVSVTDDYDFILPATPGNAGEVLTTDGTGTNTLTWKIPSSDYNISFVDSTHNGGNPYVTTSSDNVIIVTGTSSNSIAITLGEISSIGKVHYNIMDKGGAGINSITINVSGSDTIYDPWNEAIVTSFQLDASYNSVQFINDGDAWFVY